jgi:DUF971 family protein
MTASVKKPEQKRLNRSVGTGVDQTERRAKPAFKTRNRAQIAHQILEPWQTVPKRLDPCATHRQDGAEDIQLGECRVKVVVDDQLRVLHASKEVQPKKAQGELIGIEKIDAVAAALLFAELSQMMFDDTHNQAYYESAYERLIARDIALHSLDITGLNCTKVATHDDFVVANKMFRARAKPAAPKHHHLLRASSIKAYKRT